MTAKIVVAMSLVVVACSSSAGSPAGPEPSQFAPGNLPAANNGMPEGMAQAGCAAGDPSCSSPPPCTGPDCSCDAAAREELSCVTRVDPGDLQQPGMTTCAPGLTACAGSCADLSSDAKNCGACGVQCGMGVCSSGRCPAGKQCATELAISTPV